MLRGVVTASFAFSLAVCSAGTLRGQQDVGAGRGLQPNTLNAIVGRVLDPSGRPMPGTFVTALRPQNTGGRVFSPVSVLLHALTNDRGEFRLEGLTLGEFYVVALPHNKQIDASLQLNRSGYANTFYPSASTPGAAKTVPVTSGRPATIEIRLLPSSLATVSGTVLNAAGVPVSGGRVGLSHGDGLFGLDGRAVAIRADGTFVAPALQPGTYFLLYDETPLPLVRGTTQKISRATVRVVDGDVPGVRVTPLEMVKVAGRVVVDAAARGSLQAGMIRIGASPTDFGGNPGPQRPGTVNEDLTFEFRTWPSIGHVRVTVASPAWALKAVRLNGVDVTDKDIEFIQGKQISGLEVELVKGR
ncbi:MAG: carboxypeptidase-like regulatory domain-containing protein [Vicinamibacterales bacterium]